MASPIYNTFASGTNNTTLTAANTASPTAIASQTVSGATTGQFSNSFTHSNGLSYRLSYAITQAGYATWNFSPTATTTRTAWRFYFYVPTGQANTTQDLFSIRSASAIVITVGINSTGKLTIKNQLGTTRGTSTANLPFDTWVRVEVACAIGTTTSNGTIACSYYLADSGSAVESLISGSSENTGTAAITNVRLGSAATVASARSIYYDDFAGAELASGFIGASAKSGDAALTVTATRAASGHPDFHGTAAASTTVTGAASGHVNFHAGAAASETAAGAAAGTVGKHAAAASTVTPTGAAGGTVGKHSTGVLAVTDVGAAAGSLGRHTAAAITVTETGAAAAHAGRQGAGPSSTTVTLAAGGTVGRSAGAASDVTVTLAASGTVHHHASADLTITVTGQSGVRSDLTGDANLSMLVTLLASGSVQVPPFPAVRTLTGFVATNVFTGDGSTRTLTSEVRDPLTLIGTHERTLSGRAVPTTLEGGNP